MDPIAAGRRRPPLPPIEDQTETGIGIKTEIETGTGIETETGTVTEIGTERGKGIGTENGKGIETGIEIETGTKAGTKRKRRKNTSGGQGRGQRTDTPSPLPTGKAAGPGKTLPFLTHSQLSVEELRIPLPPFFFHVFFVLHDNTFTKPYLFTSFLKKLGWILITSELFSRFCLRDEVQLLCLDLYWSLLLVAKGTAGWREWGGGGGGLILYCVYSFISLFSHNRSL